MGDEMPIEFDPKIGPASILGAAQLIAIVVGGAVVWTQLSDKVTSTSEKLDTVKTVVSSLRSDLKASQQDRAQQSERLGRVETAVTFISSYIKLGANQSDGTAPFNPRGSKRNDSSHN
jgi:outer membrane murein-binding lipoprotein Lpp